MPDPFDVMSSSSPSRAVPVDVGGWAATILSYGVNPLVFPPLVYGLVLYHVGAPPMDVAWGAGIGLLFLGLVPLAHVSWMRLRGDIGSLEIRDRRKRTEPFLVVLGAGLVAFGVVVQSEVVGHALLAALVGCHVLNTVLLFVITTWWKISVHCASVAGAVATLAFMRVHVPGIVFGAGATGSLLLGLGGLLVPVLIWARVRSDAHTPAQAVAGTVLGGVAPYLELWLVVA